MPSHRSFLLRHIIHASLFGLGTSLLLRGTVGAAGSAGGLPSVPCDGESAGSAVVGIIRYPSSTRQPTSVGPGLASCLIDIVDETNRWNKGVVSLHTGARHGVARNPARVLQFSKHTEGDTFSVNKCLDRLQGPDAFCCPTLESLERRTGSMVPSVVACFKTRRGLWRTTIRSDRQWGGAQCQDRDGCLTQTRAKLAEGIEHRDLGTGKRSCAPGHMAKWGYEAVFTAKA